MITKEQEDLLKPGDILLTGSWWIPLSVIIQLVTRSKFSHAEIYVGDGFCIGAHLMGIKKYSLKKVTGLGRRVACMRSKLSKKKAEKIIALAETFIGKGYDYFHIVNYLWRIILGTLGKAPMNDDPAKHVCTEFVSVCYHKVGLKIGGEFPDNTVAEHILTDPNLSRIF